MIDAFRRSSAARITAVMPYYGYARQDRKDKPRVPISAKLVANILSAAGANRVLTMDLHKAQIQGFFDIPVDHLFAAPVLIDYLSRMDYPNLTMVAPDAGGAERARAYAKRLNAELAVIDKRRTEDGTAEVMNVVGEVAGRTCIIQDDIDRHRRDDHEGRGGAQGQRRGEGDCVRGARGAVGAGDRAHREVADRQDDRDEHDPAHRRQGTLREDQGAVGRAAARAGDQEHPRRDVGLIVVCIEDRRSGLVARQNRVTRRESRVTNKEERDGSIT